jgi:histidine kinase
MKRLAGISLKNKIVFSILAVILAISVAIAFLTRFILVSSLTSELETRGSAIAGSVADRAGSAILDKNLPSLLALIFDEAMLRERRHIISYIYVTDTRGQILCHSFVRPFPREILPRDEPPADKERIVHRLSLDGQEVMDVAMPVTEGLYRIGIVHVGLSMQHIDSLEAKLRITFLGFISAIVLIVSLISTRISRHITMPISRLTRVADELSRGNFDIKLDITGQDEGWDTSACPAYTNTDLPCWSFDLSSTAAGQQIPPETLRTCKQCVFYRKRRGDEVVQLADSFRNMVWSIKLYRRRLRESEEKYRSLFDSGPDPIFVIDFSIHRILDANPRAQEIYGFSKEELVGRSFLDLGPEPNLEFLAFFSSPDMASACINAPKVLHYKKGERPFFVNIHACSTTYRGKAAIIIAATDVTEMMEKDAQLIQASKMKSLGEMSAGIAHELNQPLNAIKMGSEFLMLMSERNREVPQESFHKVVTQISAQVDRAAEIIQTLRSFGRKAGLLKEKVDLSRAVTGMLTIVRRQLELENIRLVLDLAEDLPPVLAHDNRLQQVFFNLLTNARDAINERGEEKAGDRVITLRTWADGATACVSVADTGVGIPAAVRDKIFEPFFTTKEAGKGMGLGLAIIYGIVKDYGGALSIDSQPGQGATFTVRFPAAV